MSLYTTWRGMFDRCNCVTNKKYHRYGGRGLTICERWNLFENFREDMGPAPLGHTLNRIDNDGPYSPGNCEWATIKNQNRNRVDNHVLEFNGQSHCVAAWAEILGVPRESLKNRLSRGWSVEDTLTIPIPSHGLGLRKTKGARKMKEKLSIAAAPAPGSGK